MGLQILWIAILGYHSNLKVSEFVCNPVILTLFPVKLICYDIIAMPCSDTYHGDIVHRVPQIWPAFLYSTEFSCMCSLLHTVLCYVALFTVYVCVCLFTVCVCNLSFSVGSSIKWGETVIGPCNLWCICVYSGSNTLSYLNNLQLYIRTHSHAQRLSLISLRWETLSYWKIRPDFFIC